MKFLVLGCNGMAGHIISIYLREAGYEVVGFARKALSHVETMVGDARDERFLKKTIDLIRPDIIVNCIGVLNQFAEADKASAVYLNSYLPHMLVNTTKNRKTRVFHISTDCVFSGQTGGYTEASFRDGVTFYDRSKSLGEIEDSKNLTLRSSIVGPDLTSNGIGLLNWFMKQEGPIGGYTKSIWTGQTTLQLAKTIEEAAISDASGLINTVPNTSISKYELLQMMNQYLRNNCIIINPVDGISADKSLVRTNFILDYIIPSYEVMMKELATWMHSHRELYPHYTI